MLGPDLERDVGCRADLLWRCDLSTPGYAEAFATALNSVGFVTVPGASRMGLHVLEETSTRHRVVVVLRTGRVQLRLDAESGHEARRTEARRLFETMRRATAGQAAARGSQ
ncbi:MAG: hypothetical protein AAGA54_31385 [Myxococcota bacterium]